MIITIDDIRKCGYCVTGARSWFTERDMDFRTFIREGIDAQEFLEKGDAKARIVVEAKIKRVEERNG